MPKHGKNGHLKNRTRSGKNKKRMMDIQREIAALPALVFEPGDDTAETAGGNALPQILSKHGRLILRMSAAVESLDQRYEKLARQLEERDRRIETLTDACQTAEREAEQIAQAAIHLMDALDWVHDALTEKGQNNFSYEVEAARRDCLRRLAAVGVSEVPCVGQMDGRLHDGLDTVADAPVPKYHIVQIVRRGFQRGTQILRRAGVVTAA